MINSSDKDTVRMPEDLEAIKTLLEGAEIDYEITETEDGTFNLITLDDDVVFTFEEETNRLLRVY